MSWDKGRDRIDELVAQRELQRVTPSRPAALLLIEQARRHLRSAAQVCDTDPQGAYVLAYDATRKAMAAVYEAQGLRATSTGGHVVLHEAALAQFEPPLGHLFKPFNRMRVRRHQVEYASTENPEVTPEEVRRDLTKARALIEDFALKAIDLVSS
ncbi:hypothetical protein AB2L27_13930 [Kineococcus sp. LSe6-4]|uniref:HEPN domain-containing protein n=1 Tax=Kineococcus halophytocola TaxID=3234027 RepID=A0ABV4H2Q5_9ACTN